ncbi:MAG: ATP-binding protein [Rhodobacteraceae bacterium]|nr:ATP-binding protein [Paracoccaceae bacterium]
MTCFQNLDVTFAAGAAAVLWLICFGIVFWVGQRKWFAGKTAFVLTFVAMLWWLFTVALDLASPGESCKLFWSIAAWPGITLLPIAWSFFIYDYTMSTYQGNRPWRLWFYVAVPCVVALIALTNNQTHLLYGTETRFVVEEGYTYVFFAHGPLFYAVASILYVFVLGALGVLIYAYYKAKKVIRPFLRVLFLITIAPLAANMSYVLGEVTFYGFDPTPFMFAVSLIALSWVLLNNTMMDTAAQGRNLFYYSTQDPVIILDAEGRIAHANPAAKALFRSKMPRYGQLVDGLEIIGARLRAFMTTGYFDSSEAVRLGGQAFEARVLPIESPIQSKRPILGWSVSFVDITERELSAEALREALGRAEAANHAKSQFLAMISHELRTPMTSVKGGLDLALHGAVGDISDPLRNLLTIAQRNSLRLLKLVEDVLDLQKLDLGTMKLDLQELNAGEFLRDVIEEYEAFAAEADVRLVNDAHDAETQLYVDPHRLKQVVGNVISNAVKFSPAGGEVICSMRLMGDRLRVSVKDSGIGIPEGMEDDVFGRFNQVDGASMKVPGGSGLGMHIAKILVERMGGGISYESRPDMGATFHIDVPVSAGGE